MTETAGQQAPVPGWYQDPQGAGLRWWDGSGWTTHTQESPPPAAPQATASQAPAAPQPQPAQPQRTQAPPAAAQTSNGAPPTTHGSSSQGVKVTGSKEKKSAGSLSDKLNDNPVPVLLVLAVVLILVVVLFVL